MSNTLKREQWAVLIAGDVDDPEADVEHVVTVIHGDQIRAQASARQLKFPSAEHAPWEHNSLFVYHAMRRLELTDVKYHDWCDTVLALDKVKGDDDQPALVTVDPTPAPSEQP